MRHSILFFVLAAVALAAACEPSPAPTDPGEHQSLQAATAPEGEINQLKDALFPEPEIEDASDLFAAMKSSLTQGDTISARDAMFDMVVLALTLFADDQLLDPDGSLTTSEALVDLIQALYQFVGFDAPAAGDLQPILDGQEDGVVGVLGPEGGTLVTPDEFAGVEFPPGAVDGDILVIIERNDVQDPSECLPTPLPQAEGCYFYDTSPDIGDVNDQDSFNVDVTVGVCLDPSADEEDYLLHKFDPENPQEGVIPLPETPAGFLDCTGFLTMGPPSSSWLGRLASATRSSLDRHVLSRIGPAPLQAADQGLGGTVGAFSTFGWAEAGTLSIFSGDGQDGDTESLLTDPLQIELSRAHTSQGVIENVEVEFEVLAGGGDLASVGSQVFTTTANDITNSDGIAGIAWRLGSAVGTQTIVARVPGAVPDSVVFTADAADLFQRHDDLASFQSAIGNTATQTQDFENFSIGDPVSVLFQGVLEVSSPFDQLEVSSCSGDKSLFGSDVGGNPTRSNGEGRYELDFLSNRDALAFEVRSQDPATGPAVVEVQTGSGNASFLVSNDGQSESDPTFFGLTSTVAIDRIIVHEGPEVGGTGNEEICLDDFIVENLFVIE